MDTKWNTTYIDPKNLLKISRGKPEMMVKYLRQFLQLIPPRIETLKGHLVAQDRKKIRQTLHQMSPQLQFFEIPGVMPLILRLELEYETIPWDELMTLVTDIFTNLEEAHKEVEGILHTQFT